MMNIRKVKRAVLRLASLLACLLVCISGASAVSVAGFRDVPKTYWAYGSITRMSEKGLIQGSGTKFRPGEPVSKQAFLSMVCRASGLDDRKLEKGAGWAAPAMAYGAYRGWFEAGEMADGTAPISRELAAQLLVNALFPEALGQGSELSFSDQEEVTRLSHVQAAAKLGLIGGYADGSFRPQAELSRAAAAALLDRALGEQQVGAPVQVPVLMYHDVSYLGRGYSKTPEIFERQMQELKDAGFHTVFFSQLIDYVERGTPLPEKPIVISVDDGYASNYTYLYPILQKLDMKIELSVIGDAIQYADWGLSWDQVREMSDSGLVSIQAHTKSLHGDSTAQGGRLGVLKLAFESWEDYIQVIAQDTTAILDKVEQATGRRPQVYTYPRGQWNPMVEAISGQLGCLVSVTTKDGVAVVRQGDPSSLRLMDRIGMDFRNGSVVKTLKSFGYKG